MQPYAVVNHALIVKGLRTGIGNFINNKTSAMKNINFIKIVPLIAGLAVFISCTGNDPQKEAEAREKAKVGKVFNPEEQGIEHENRDNQFPYSRNDDKQGTGLETGAPSDTTKLKATQEQTAPKP